MKYEGFEELSSRIPTPQLTKDTKVTKASVPVVTLENLNVSPSKKVALFPSPVAGSSVGIPVKSKLVSPPHIG